MTSLLKMVVVIPTHSRNALLERTLSSIARAQIPKSLKSVRVVENGGHHGATDVVRQFSESLNAEYHYHPIGNKSASLNHVMSDLDDEYVIFLDDDVRIDPNTLLAYERAINAHGPPAFFGGPFGCDYERQPPDWLLDFLPASARGWSSSSGSGISPDMPFIGFNWAALARDIRKIGGFNPDFGPGSKLGASGQEMDMQTRLQIAGLKAQYVPDAMVWHCVPASSCSTNWAVQRVYKQGCHLGLMSPRAEGSLYGLPPWIIRRALARYLLFLKTRFSSSERDHFLARYRLYETLGEMKGMLQRHNKPIDEYASRSK